MNYKLALLAFGFLLLTLISLSSISAASYSRAAPAYTFGYQTTPYIGGQVIPFDRQMCGAGQDFILQIDPLGCTPSVVRSDLLEEQEVVVFCPVYATQLNPLISIEKINHVTISSRDLPREVLTVGYFPARAALGRFGRGDEITNPVFDNIGYATIVLRQQGNESAMPDFVEGNLTATMRYNIHNAFGTGKSVYYLPLITDDNEWNRNFQAYAFWDGRGYLRLEGSDSDSASIGVYSDRDVSGSGRRGEKTKIATLNLEKGGKPEKIFMPGFNYCLGGINARLEGLENPDTRAKLRINSDVIELQKGTEFLENRCTLRSIDKQGLNLKVEVSCKEDEKRSNFPLYLSPKIKLMFNSEEQEYGIGDRLPFSNDPNKPVYLGFIGTERGTDNEENLYVRFVQTPYNEEKLTENMLSEVARFDNDDTPTSSGSVARRVAGWVGGRIQDMGQWLERFSRYLGQGTEISNQLNFGQENNVYGTQVKLLGFAGPKDSVLDSNSKANYDRAMEDYKTIIEDFLSERYPPNDVKTLGEQAFTNAIRLSSQIGQMRTASDLCQQFLENFDSVAPNVCNEKLLLSNIGSSSQSVLINGRTHLISLEGMKKPSPEEYGANIIINNAGECSGAWTLGIEEENCLSDSEFIKLLRVTDEFAEFDVSSVQESTGKELFWKTNNLRLRAGESQVIGKNNYRIALEKINLQKVAKISLNPEIDYARSNATFSFKIGIEKRGIKLSPEQTKEKIQSLNETIEKWTKINDNLGNVVEAGKTACLATTGYLTLKNFFSNLGGKGIARQKVMSADNVGWYDQCRQMVNQGQYKDVEACLLANNDAIEDSVSAYESVMNQQNQRMDSLQSGVCNTRFLGETVCDTDALVERLLDDSQFKTDISSCTSNRQINVAGKPVNAGEIIINSDSATLTQLKDLQLNCRLLSSSGATGEIAKSQAEKILGEIYSNSLGSSTRQTLSSQYGIGVIIGATTPLREYPLTQVNTWGEVKNKFTGIGMPDETYVTIFVDQSTGKEYLLTLNNDFVIAQTYLITGNALSVASPQNINPLGINLKRYDANSYNNEYQNPLVRYYETEPYKGLPAVVPFDIKNGWYAAVKSDLPILGGLRSYDASGRVSSFYVCNIGPNKREEFIGGDDVCRGFVPGTGQAPDFPGLSPQDSARKMDQAVSAIRQATDAYRSGVSQVTVSSQRVRVGEPAANIPSIQCEDFMSPSDCNLMFNVCDPFVCPSSRCNLGGAYPVKDVVQSGIGGSIALCLPNWPEVKVPICISGVHAGVEGYLSVLQSYQQCLQTSLETGQTIGICDELNSVYQCEFFWRQGLPLIKYALPKVLGSALGQDTGRGGGEYLGVQDALDNVEKSIGFFSQYYADDSYRAFQARSVEEIAGTEICRNWISASGPSGNLIDALTSPDSPSQFYGRFEEIPFTTATNPPASQYKVFYHIYAGKDFPAYFQVYLRGTGSSFFRDTDFPRQVASGFIPKGEFKTETRDFTAPSGYKQLCIVVNGQEECGFKEVTTEFGINYLSEQFVAQQASQTDIKSEAECVSGSPSAYSFLNPNIQAGAEEAINPAIYKRGIIRVCSTANPGQGTDVAAGTQSSRWQEVGNCGSQNLKCWLDTNSIRDVVRNSYTEDQILGEVEDDYLAALQREGNYLADFEGFVKELDEVEGNVAQSEITKINENIDKVFLNNQKGYLYLRRGIAYGNLAQIGYDLFISSLKTAGTSGSGETSGTGTQTGTTQALSCEDCGKGLFNACDELECTELSSQSGKACSFEEGFLANTCKVDAGTTQTTQLTCTSQTSCQKSLGSEIIELAVAKKQARNIADSSVQRDTGAKSFECLALQVAMVESTIQHCRQTQQNQNPLYCEGRRDELISGDNFASMGIMQINTQAHPNVDVADFEINVNYGIDLLINNSNLPQRRYVCNGKTYSGWTRALRQYNGWPATDNIDCSPGNTNYVEDVIRAKNNVATLFPECA